MEISDELLTEVTDKIEKECGFPNAAFLVLLILLLINPETWTVDKTYLARLYQAIDIIEKDERLKNGFAKHRSDTVSN